VATPATPSSNAPPVGTPTPPRRRLLISENRLGLDELEKLDVEARLSLGELVARNVSYRDLQADIHLKGGRLEVGPASAQLPGGKVEGTLKVESKAAESPMALRLTGPGLALKPLLVAFGRPEDISGVLDASIDLRGVGETPHDIAATLNGTLGLALENGEIDNGIMLPLISSLMRAGRQMPFLDGPGRTRLRCAAIRLDFTDGVGSSTALVLDSQRVLVQGAGQVHLTDETLALRLRPLLRTGGTGLVVPVRVDGTLREPKAIVDSEAAAVAAGEAALGTQTGRDNWLGKLNSAMNGMGLAERGGDACRPALAAARGQAGTPAAGPPTPAAGATKPAPNAAGDILRRLMR
jgi:AsmA protein